jgi:hypothetical protein
LIFWYTIFMSKAITRTRKSRGRPSTGAESVHLRVLPDQSAAIDGWMVKQKEPGLTRPEAIRRLVELGLKVKTEAKPVGKTGRRSRAAELAAKQIERMIDPSAPSEERDRRERRLTKGPSEFREDRVDQPKAKK